MIALTRTENPGTTKDTISWAPITGLLGYKFTVDGKISHTWDPTRTTLTVSRSAERVLVEAFGTKNSGVWPSVTPPTGYGTGFGYLRLGNSEVPATNPTEYDLIGLGGSGFPNTLTSKTMIYMSGTNVPKSWSAGVPYAEAQANGWILRGASGNEIHNRGFPDAMLGDVGSPGYQAAWCRNVEATMRAVGADGFYADDTIGFGGMWWNEVPTKYPNRAAWDAAMVSFCKALWDHFNPKGFYVAHNAGDYEAGNFETDNGMLKMRWWAKVGPYAHGLMAESWMFLKEWGQGVRIVGPGWHQQWDAIRAYHKFCNGEPYPVTGGQVQLARPIDLIALDYGAAADEAAKRYCLLTFLLDYQRKGPVHIWSRSDSPNPWSAVNDQVLALGNPTAVPTKNGNVHTRQFQNGRITVDAGAGTSSIS